MGNGIQYEVLTQEEQVREILRCKQDFVYFIEHYVYFDTGAGFNRLKLAPKQKELADTIVNKHNVLVLGSRQTGKTTLMVAYCAWAMLFFPAISITFISRKEEQAKKQMTDLATLFERLPPWLRPTLEPNQATIKTIVENGSTISIESVLTNPDGKGRGMRSHIVWIDEAAFLKTLDPLIAALLPTTAQRFLMAQKNGLPYGVVMTTTPNGTKGVGRTFFELWSEAERVQKEYGETGDPEVLKESFFVPFKIHWSDLPFYSEEWYEQEKKKFGKNRIRKFHQEYDLLFLGSEDTFLPDEILKKLQSKPSIKRIGKIWIFEEFDPNKKYIIATDVATAFGECNSVIQVINAETLEQVAEFVDKLPIGPPAPYNLIEMLKKLAELYPNAIVSFEYNGIGNNLVEKLPFMPEFKDKLYYETETSKKPGFNTNTATRQKMFDILGSVLSTDPTIIKSSRTIKELMALVVERDGRIIHGPGEKDDTVLALGQAYVIADRLSMRKVSAFHSTVNNNKEGINFVLSLNSKTSRITSTGIRVVEKPLDGTEGIEDPLLKLFVPKRRGK